MLTLVEHRVSQRKEGQGIGFLGLNMTRENSTITYQDSRMIYGNLGAIDSLTIEDNKVEYHYTEFSDQNIITPILYHFEANVLLLIQAFRELTKDFMGRFPIVIHYDDLDTKALVDLLVANAKEI